MTIFIAQLLLTVFNYAVLKCALNNKIILSMLKISRHYPRLFLMPAAGMVGFPVLTTPESLPLLVVISLFYAVHTLAFAKTNRFGSLLFVWPVLFCIAVIFNIDMEIFTSLMFWK